MPDAVISDAGERRLLARLIAGWVVVYRLYTNNYTPTTGDTGGEYTQPTWPGYLPITAANWQPPLTDASGGAYTSADLCIFIRGAGPPSGSSAYGYYTTDASGGYLWGQRDDAAPYPITAEGGTYVVFPAFRGFNCPPTG